MDATRYEWLPVQATESGGFTHLYKALDDLDYATPILCSIEFQHGNRQDPPVDRAKMAQPNTWTQVVQFMSRGTKIEQAEQYTRGRATAKDARIIQKFKGKYPRKVQDGRNVQLFCAVK